MAEIIRLRSSMHDDVQELLPWLVNGTLAPDEASRVETHLDECPECRAALEAERRLGGAVASLPLDCDSSWERMKLRLKLDPPVRVQPIPALWRRPVPFGWAVGVPLAAAAAAAVLFLNVTPTQPVEPKYRALGTIEVAQPANLIVQFEPATRIGDVQAALQSVDARLVDGPTETGAYLLRVDQTRRELALKRLHDNQAIALAEPIDAANR